MNTAETYNQIAGAWEKVRSKPFPIVKKVLEKWKDDKKKLILDAGCGSGRHTILASNMGFNVIGMDNSIEMIKIARSKDKKAKFIIADLRFPPFKKDIFDGVIYIASLHHLGTEDAELSLTRIKNTMKYSGEMIISVWNKIQKRFLLSKRDSIVNWKLDGKSYPRFYHLYTPLEFKKLVSKIGFKKISVFLDERKPIISSFSKNIFGLVEK